MIPRNNTENFSGHTGLDLSGTEKNTSVFNLKNFKTATTERTAENFNFPRKLLGRLPSGAELKQYIGVSACVITLWGTSWFLYRDAVLPGGLAFDMTAVVVLGYVSGHTLERYTTITPVAGMTLVGALYRHFGSTNFLENPIANAVDYHLRRVYPVVILTRGPLGWSWPFIRQNPARVFSLATLPWLVECLSVAVFVHVLLKFTWYWGLHLGSILASVSPAVIAATATALDSRGLGSKNNIALLVLNAGGLDTAVSEGMFGIINTAIFTDTPVFYKIVKALAAIPLGVALGVGWGVLVDCVPDHADVYAPAVRSLLVFSGGLLVSYAGAAVGWGGIAGVAIMVCAATAATRWARRGWPLNDNPVSEVYKLAWRIFEPMLFTLSGYYLEVSSLPASEVALMAGCVLAALSLRLVTAFLVALANELSVKEGLFVASTWIPKAIVEAVLVRVATDSLWSERSTSEDKRIARVHSNVIVIAIIITSTLGSALTTALGPILLAQDSRVAPEDVSTPTRAPQNSINNSRKNSQHTIRF